LAEKRYQHFSDRVKTVGSCEERELEREPPAKIELANSEADVQDVVFVSQLAEMGALPVKSKAREERGEGEREREKGKRRERGGVVELH